MAMKECFSFIQFDFNVARLRQKQGKVQLTARESAD